jgi:DNA-binding MarR family transcriptional regulator
MSHYDAATYRTRSSIGYLMRRGASLMRDELDRSFARYDVNFIQWCTLMMVREMPAVTPGDLCRSLHHDSGAFTRLLAHLEARGLLRRERNDADRRLVRLHLSASGRRLVELLLPIVVERLNQALAGFTSTEVALLGQLLGRLIAHLEAGESEAARRP